VAATDNQENPLTVQVKHVNLEGEEPIIYELSYWSQQKTTKYSKQSF